LLSNPSFETTGEWYSYHCGYSRSDDVSKEGSWSAFYPKHLHNYDGTTRRAYSVDWKMMAEVGIDYAVCGFGTIVTTATINALADGNPNNPPKLIGGGYPDSGEDSFIECYYYNDGGLLYYGGNYTDDPLWSYPVVQ